MLVASFFVELYYSITKTTSTLALTLISPGVIGVETLSAKPAFKDIREKL